MAPYNGMTDYSMPVFYLHIKKINKVTYICWEVGYSTN